MDHPALKEFELNQMKTEYPYFLPGDTIRVNTRVIEGDKERLQAFEGIVIARSGGGLGETFTVRKISYGIGVERTFPLHSPRVDSIKVVRRGHARRAKLYYLRERVGKATRLKARRKKRLDLDMKHFRAKGAAPMTETPAPLKTEQETASAPETAVENAKE